MPFGNATNRTDLEFVATTGQAKTNIVDLGTVYNRTTRQMTDSALKLAIAEGRRDAAIARSGPESRAAMSAELAYRAALEETSSSVERQSVSLRTLDRDLDRTGRGLVVGSGLMERFGRYVAYGSTALIGGVGLSYALETIIKKGTQGAAVISNLRNAVIDSGLSWELYRNQIDAATEATSAKAKIDKDELYATLEILVRATGDINTALKLNADAANISRGANKPLATVAEAVAKAWDGQTGSLRRLIPTIKAGVTGQQAIAEASKATAGAAAAAADSAAGAQQGLTVAVGDTEESISRDLLPTVVRYERQLTSWLGNTQNQKRIQADVNKLLKDGTQIVHGLADAEQLLAPPIHAVIDALGGLEHAGEIALVLGLTLKAKRAASSLGLIQSASARARTQIVADAAVEEKAIAGVATEAASASAIVGRIGAYGVNGIIPVGARGAATESDETSSLIKKYGSKIGGPLALATLLASSYVPQGGAASNLAGASTAALAGYAVSGGNPLVAVAAAGGYEVAKGGEALSNILADAGVPGISHAKANSTQIQQLAQLAAAGNLAQSDLDKFHQFGAISDQVYAGLSKILADATIYTVTRTPGYKQLSTVAVPGSVSGGYSTATGLASLSPLARAKAALSAASTTPRTSDDLAALTQERSLLAKAIATETSRRNGATGKEAAKFEANLEGLENQFTDAVSQIDSINQAAADKRAAETKKAAEAAAKTKRQAAAAAAKAEAADREQVKTQATTLSDQAEAQLRTTRGQTTVISGPGGKLALSTPAPKIPEAADKLIELYKREATDPKLNGADRAHFLHLANVARANWQTKIDAEEKTRTDLLKKARTTQADRNKQNQQLREQLLANALQRAQLEETLAGTNQTALAKANADEIKAQAKIVANDEAELKGLTGLARAQKQAQLLSDQQTLAQLKQANAAASSTEDYFSDAASEFATYGGNAGPLLSGQDTRGLLAGILLEVRKSNGHAKTTAGATTAIAKTKVTMIDTARRGF